jgi:hypothetical protein
MFSLNDKTVSENEQEVSIEQCIPCCNRPDLSSISGLKQCIHPEQFISKEVFDQIPHH